LKKIPIFLALVPVLLVFGGCGGGVNPWVEKTLQRGRVEMQRERNKKNLERMKKAYGSEATDTPRYDDPDYREAYYDGYNSGYREGKQDCLSGDEYGPSLKSMESGDWAYDSGYTEGFNEGYYEGFSEAFAQSEASQETITKDGETYVVETYDQGYNAGYPVGYAAGEQDAKVTELYYEPAPSVELVDSHCEGHFGADYRPGWVQGYTSGYVDAWRKYNPSQ